MQLVPPTDQRLRILLKWFPDNHSVSIWGGPNMRLPMTFDTLKADIRIDTLASHFLVDEHGHCVGFGQYYDRQGRCHLGRLVISPARRGAGLGKTLIDLLATQGANKLGLFSQSLFVLPENTMARKLYERLGFVDCVYPGNDLDMENVDYMIRPASQV